MTKNQDSSWARTDGWIFSRSLDVALFIGPLVLAMALSVIFENDLSVKQTFLYIILLEIFANAGHVATTILPVYLDRRISSTLKYRKWFLPIVTILLFYLIFYISKIAFWHIFASVAVFHIIMQQFGYFKISNYLFRANVQFSIPKKIESFFIFNIFIFPIYYWLSGKSVVSLRWFVDGDLGPGWIQYYWSGFEVIYFTLLFLYIGVQIVPLLSGKKINYGKLILTVSTWAWFYGGIRLAQTPLFFATATLLLHGLTYIIFSKNYWQKLTKYEPVSWIKKTGLLFSGAFIVGILAFAVTWYYLLSHYLNVEILIPLLWSPLVIHYIFDGIIWRASFLKVSSQ